MKIGDIFGYSFNAIKLRKLRAALTTLGVIVGIAAIVALLSITQGLQVTITEQLNQGLSANTLIVTPSSGNEDGNIGLGGGSGSGFSLVVNHTDTINALSDDIETSIAIMSRNGAIEAGNFSRSTTLYGVDFATYAQVYPSFKAQTGAVPLDPVEVQVVVGNRVSQSVRNGTVFFGAGELVNVSWVNATVLPPVKEQYLAIVAGVLEPLGGFSFSGPSDTGVYIPIEKAQSFFGTDQCSMIVVILKHSDNTTITDVSKLIESHFSGQVSVIAATTIIDTIGIVFSTIQLFLAGIAAISLLVAGIGIMNIMIVSLIERTREIGILKALGMRGGGVLSIFLGESVIIGLIGALVGIGLGWGLAVGVSEVLGSGLFSVGAGGGGSGTFAVSPLLTPEVFVGALAFGVGVSVIFALYPAWRASKLKPVDALRYE